MPEIDRGCADRRGRRSRLAAMLVVALVAVLLLGQSPPALAARVAAAVPKPSNSGIQGTEFWLQGLGFDKAWTKTQGAGVKVAVIDSGVDGSVDDLKGVVVGGKDFSGAGSANGQKPVGSTPQHGTFVGALIAGRGTGNDGTGVLGVAPQATLLAASVDFDTGQSVRASSDAQVASAIRWAVDQGAKVINMSFTRNSLGWPRSWDSAFAYAESKDVVLVAAAGNRGSGTDQVGAPGTIPGVLTVGGTTREGKASTDASTNGVTLTVMAPAEQLVGALPGGGYQYWSGSSGAAPIVAGLAALIRSQHPTMNAASVINTIMTTATPGPGAHPSVAYGYGTINAAAAVNGQISAVDANPLGALTEWIALYRPSTDRWPQTLATSDVYRPSAPASQTDDHGHAAWAAETQLTSALPFLVWGLLGLLTAGWLFMLATYVRGRSRLE